MVVVAIAVLPPPCSPTALTPPVAQGIGSAMQFMQPLIGAISDRLEAGPCGSWLGRRRPFLVLGQAISCLGCLMMMWAVPVEAAEDDSGSDDAAGHAEQPLAIGQYWLLSGGYTAYMLGNAVGYGVYPSLISNHVPLSQRGLAGGLQGLFALLGSLTAGGIGFLAGTGDHDRTIFLSLVAANAATGLVAVISFGSRPSLSPCVPEAPSPPPPCRKELLQADDSVSRLSSSPSTRATCAAEVGLFFSGFRSGGFRAVFLVFFLASSSQFFAMTYMETFLRDRVPKPFVFAGLQLTNSSLTDAKQAESAVSIFSLAQALASFLTVLPAGALSDRVGRKPLLVRVAG
jgi:MFS family permease